jgi:DNA polymerase I-like protein with 3'-5' exonuclease and polymerase domains
MTYCLIETLTAYESCLLSLQTYSTLAVDLETYVLPAHRGLKATALDPHVSSISTIQMLGVETEPSPLEGEPPPSKEKTPKGLTTYILDLIALEKEGYAKESLLDFLKSKETLIAHNATFEIKFLRKYLGETLTNFWCTKVASTLISNAFGNQFYRTISSHSLASLCKDYLNVTLTGKGKVQQEDWSTRPLRLEQLEYASRDVIYLPQLKAIFEATLYPDLPDPDTYRKGDVWGLGMRYITDLEMRFLAPAAEGEYNGFPFNKQGMMRLEQTVQDDELRTGEIYKLSGELAQALGLSYEYSLAGEPYPIATPKSRTALNSPIFIQKVVKEHLNLDLASSESRILARIIELLDQIQGNDDPEYSSEEEELVYLELAQLEKLELQQKGDLLKNILLYKRLAKMISMKLTACAHPLTGRIHYSLNTVGAATGRTTSARPNSQNINGNIYIKIVYLSLLEALSGDCVRATDL